MASKQDIKAAFGIWSTISDHKGMMGVALTFDALSAIPWGGIIFSFLGYATLWLWMEMEGMKPGFGGETKQIAKKAASFTGEFIAGALGFGIVPGISMWAFFVIAEHKAETNDNAAINKKKIEETKNQFRPNQENSQQKQMQQRTKKSAYMQ